MLRACEIIDDCTEALLNVRRSAAAVVLLTALTDNANMHFISLKLKCVNKMTEGGTHRLVDSFAEDGKHEDSCNGWREVAGDRLDVVEELTALG